MDFISEHAPAVTTIMGLMVTLIGFLGMSFFREFRANLKEHQIRQDLRLGDLENRTNHLSDSSGRHEVEYKHLADSLADLVTELKAEREQRRYYEEKNDEAHSKIIVDLRDLKRVSGAASA
jgi:hypothetical protein